MMEMGALSLLVVSFLLYLLIYVFTYCITGEAQAKTIDTWKKCPSRCFLKYVMLYLFS